MTIDKITNLYQADRVIQHWIPYFYAICVLKLMIYFMTLFIQNFADYSPVWVSALILSLIWILFIQARRSRLAALFYSVASIGHLYNALIYLDIKRGLHIFIIIALLIQIPGAIKVLFATKKYQDIRKQSPQSPHHSWLNQTRLSVQSPRSQNRIDKTGSGFIKNIRHLQPTLMCNPAIRQKDRN